MSTPDHRKTRRHQPKLDQMVLGSTPNLATRPKPKIDLEEATLYDKKDQLELDALDSWRNGGVHSGLKCLFDHLDRVLDAQLTAYVVSDDQQSFRLVCRSGENIRSRFDLAKRGLDSYIMEELLAQNREGVFHGKVREEFRRRGMNEHYIGMNVQLPRNRYKDIETYGDPRVLVNVNPRDPKLLGEVFLMGEAFPLLRKSIPVIAREMQMQQEIERLKRQKFGWLHNKEDYFERMRDCMERMVLQSEEYTQIVIDLRWFKTINDATTHYAGDLVLEAVSEIIKRETRIDDSATLRHYNLRLDGKRPEYPDGTGTGHQYGDEWFITAKGSIVDVVPLVLRLREKIEGLDLLPILKKAAETDPRLNPEQDYEKLKRELPYAVKKGKFCLGADIGMSALPQPREEEWQDWKQVVKYAEAAVKRSDRVSDLAKRDYKDRLDQALAVRSPHEVIVQPSFGFVLLVTDPDNPDQSVYEQGLLPMTQARKITGWYSKFEADDKKKNYPISTKMEVRAGFRHKGLRILKKIIDTPSDPQEEYKRQQNHAQVMARYRSITSTRRVPLIRRDPTR